MSSLWILWIANKSSPQKRNEQGYVVSLTVLSINKSFTTGMSVGTLKAFEKNTIIDVARVKRERLRDGGRKPAKHVTLQKIC